MERNTLLRADIESKLDRYVPVKTRHLSGLENSDYEGVSRLLEERIIDFLRDTPPGTGEALSIHTFAKNLHKREYETFPPQRFVNNVLLHSLTSFYIPEPVALLYHGELTDVLKGKGPRIAYLSKNIPGKNLLLLHDKLSPESIRKLIPFIGSILGELNKRYICLLDFAPRDIILSDSECPLFVDNENLITILYPETESEKAIQLQLEEFDKSYAHLFSNHEELKESFKKNLRGNI